ncbi:MAG: type II secretion system GspH family protein [Campylobacter sp.]|uniref:type II secretion system protein n=1 Tax=Campylobacter sp. TaxID=205 RepID=UPI002A3CB83F|nr:type II secretion system protein [Campylobacter sp.]MDD6924927.1 type II secretion system protein [Campylobacteraceae bacterium]MCI7501593.1 type II secretion system GspH family protein [Campylobacter sp.]MDD7090438.1 type II secretion system protein [Campylobacteraceae bacterium]MDY4012133.1 type II secretion system protein [Campylobacter sp.]MDY5284715.1 type II secretion system protein [Campylobacter sp.]
MKKGFTMIELIFVIVILGILASVAIPRLAATREDAEISAAVANLRTLVSDLSAYYTTKGGFGTGTDNKITAKWKEITNVPTNNPEGSISDNNSLKVGGERCIDFLVNINDGTAPAYILFAKYTGGNGSTGVSALCTQVQNSEPLKPYFASKVTGAKKITNGKGAIAIGSSISIYDE